MPKVNANEKYLREKFRAWFKRVGARGNWLDFYREIEKKYEIPERFYHTFYGHIAFCIRQLYKIPKNLFENFDAVELALFLHDIEMVFGAEDNEERSAEFARDICRRMMISEKLTDRTAMIIEHTDHKGLPITRDSQFAIDCDLAIFAQIADVFNEYERNIRREFSFVPKDTYKKRRIEVLTYFLERPQNTFLTNYFTERYEAKAHENLRHSLKKLEQ